MQAHAKGKLPKDAPAKQVNLGKHNLGKFGKGTVIGQVSHPVSLGNGDCIMVTASSMAANPEMANFMNNSLMWQGNAFYNQNQQLPYYPVTHNGGIHRSVPRRGGSGYESDSVALQASRSRGRYGQMLVGRGSAGGTADRLLGQIHESSSEAGVGGHTLTGGGGIGPHKPGMLLSGGYPIIGGGANGVRYGLHPAGGGMVGGRQSGYSTDTGLVMNSGRKDSHRQAMGQHRSRQINKANHTHFKNPYDQLRIMRSSTPISRRPDSVASTTISPLPPPPSRQPPPPPQRPLPSPPFRQGAPIPDGSVGMDCCWQVQMQLATGGGTATMPGNQSRMLPSPNSPHFTACPQLEDPRAANMIIPPPPCRTPPNLSTGGGGGGGGNQKNVPYLNQFVANPMMVDLHHAGLTSISPSLIDDPANLIDNGNHIQQSNVPTGRTYFAHVTVTIHRNKGLGFSITGGVTSNPNPFRPSDKVRLVIPSFGSLAVCVGHLHS